jgi:beta-galactosidase
MDYLGEAGIGHTEYFKNGEKDTTFFMPWPWLNEWCGDIDLSRGKKPQGLYRDILWGESPIEILVHRPVPPVYTEKISYWGWPDEIPSWNWEGFESEILSVRVFSRSPVVRLYLNGQLAGEQKVQTEGPWKYVADFKVNYAPGELKAVGMKEGIEQFATRLITTGPATAIKLIADKTVISADRNSLSYVTVELTDSKGNRVMSPDRKLKLTLTGAAEIAGSGNASPRDMASYRSLTPCSFQGRALVIIRPTGKTGKAILRVESFDDLNNNAGNSLTEGIITLTITRKSKVTITQ